MLTRNNLIGPWAGLPVYWNLENEFEEKPYCEAVGRCCEKGVPGFYTAGTTGEFYAQDFDEFKKITTVTVKECHKYGKPVMVGCTSTYTLGAVKRARFAAKLGADAIQVALPFWMEVSDNEILPFFKEVSEASGGMPMSIYETQRAKKTLTIEQHKELHDAIPSYIMVKANEGTIGATPNGCLKLSEFLNVFVGEVLWSELGKVGAIGCCSGMVFWNPGVVLKYWNTLKNQNWEELELEARPFKKMLNFLIDEFAPKGLTDTGFDRLGAVASDFLEEGFIRSRKPYTSATPEDVQILRRWFSDFFPEMLEH